MANIRSSAVAIGGGKQVSLHKLGGCRRDERKPGVGPVWFGVGGGGIEKNEPGQVREASRHLDGSQGEVAGPQFRGGLDGTAGHGFDARNFPQKPDEARRLPVSLTARAKVRTVGGMQGR